MALSRADARTVSASYIEKRAKIEALRAPYKTQDIRFLGQGRSIG